MKYGRTDKTRTDVRTGQNQYAPLNLFEIGGILKVWDVLRRRLSKFERIMDDMSQPECQHDESLVEDQMSFKGVWAIFIACSRAFFQQCKHNCHQMVYQMTL